MNSWNPVTNHPQDGQRVLMSNGNDVWTGWFYNSIPERRWKTDAGYFMKEISHWKPIAPPTIKERLEIVVAIAQAQIHEWQAEINHSPPIFTPKETETLKEKIKGMKQVIAETDVMMEILS